ncbi:probable G-protein coupled receptor 139 [Stegostoma tigrinum]|uniref:probable G-protein coupled receptor 139 n=1 Tax=Stegostoma tigrinum TaxID=3053191 RepID=UPI0028706D3A|nr:probable G-protein coupled receptor 139 [Stegostoma tigrinum]
MKKRGMKSVTECPPEQDGRHNSREMSSYVGLILSSHQEEDIILRKAMSAPGGKVRICENTSSKIVMRHYEQHKVIDLSSQKMYRPIQLVRNIFYVAIAVIGLPVNSLALVILLRGKCGISSCTACYLVAMATADLLYVILEVTLYRINEYYFPVNFLDMTAVCKITSVLRRATADCSVWFTVTFTFDRFVAICCQKLKMKYCTKKIATAVLSTTGILTCFKNIPTYFRFESYQIFNNVEWLCVNNEAYYDDPIWIGFKRFEKILTPMLPFALILLINALTVRQILVASQARKRLQDQSKGQNSSDPEMESRRKSIILLFTISSGFILLWLCYLFVYFNTFDPLFDKNSKSIFQCVAYMLRDINCCTNTFIYVATLSKFREKFTSTLMLPFKQTIHCKHQ